MHKIFASKSFIDTHCHIQDISLGIDEIIKRMDSAGLERAVTTGWDIGNSKRGLDIKKKFPKRISAGFGIQPEVFIPGSDLYQPEWNVNNLAQVLAEAESELRANKYDLIGECGLDYYWLEKNALPESEVKKSKTLQKQILEAMLLFAKIFNLPVSIHSRAAEQDCIDMVKKVGLKDVVFHSYTGPLKLVKIIIDNGWHIGVNGIVTYKSGKDIREMVIRIAKGHRIKTPQNLSNFGIVLETDSPLLKPGNAQKTGAEFNLPSNVVYIWEYIYNLLRC